MFRRTTLYKAIQRQSQYLALGAASLAFAPGLALAQAEPTEDNANILEEVLVTGTLIRGVKPTGSQTIGLDSQAIIDSGAVTTNELLATVPQVSNFFNERPEQDSRGADRYTINRPNLRNLPGINSASGATTLILVDGHRIAPIGVAQSSVDPDIIPGRVIERVEVVTDGGSSLYGADAVGGVINFVTKREFEGVEIDLGYGDGDDYSGWNTTLTAGTKWENGSGYISLATTERNGLQNKDRDFAAAGSWNEDGSVLTPAGTECLTPVGAITSWFWYGAGWTDNPRAPGAGVTPVGDPCNIDGASAYLPDQERDSVYLGLVQNLSDSVTLEVKSYFAERVTSYFSYPEGDTVSEPSPAQQGLTGAHVGALATSAAVGFSYGAHPAYAHREMEIELDTWGITPELTIDLDNGWQLRNTVHYGESHASMVNPITNRAVLLGYVNDGLIDPLNIAATDAAVVNDILNWENAGETKQELFFVRSIVDGALMDLPAGKLRGAAGLEFSQDRAERRTGNVVMGGLSNTEYKDDNRDVMSLFAELSIPILETLDLSLSIRSDDYSDFGETTNPNIGFSFTPVDWFTIYGHWGESFNAPTVLDRLGTANGRFIANAAAGVPDPNMERTAARDDVFLLEGASGALQPQTAETWAIGFEIKPVEGLTLSANYYEIDFIELLGAPNPQDAQAVLLNPDKFIFDPTQAELDAFVARVENSGQFIEIDIAEVGLIVDRTIANSDQAMLKGIDFGISYVHDTGIGTMSYGLSGTHQTDFELVQNGNSIDQLAFEDDLTMSGNIAWSRDNMRAKLTLRYTGEFDANPGQAVNQTTVDDFLVADLVVGYNFKGGSALTDGLSLRFHLDNVFDEDPPEYRVQRNLNYTSYTLGRVFKLGITKKF